MSVPTLPLLSATAPAATSTFIKSTHDSRLSRRSPATIPNGASSTSAYQIICSGRNGSAVRDCSCHGVGTVT